MMRSPTRAEAALAAASVGLIATFVGTEIQTVPTRGTDVEEPGSATDQGHGRVADLLPLRISGNLPGTLVPGSRAVPMNLYLRNPNSVALALTRLTVRVDRVVAPNVDESHPCSTADFRVRPLTAPVAPLLSAREGSHLSALHVRRRYRPAVRMVNQPVNQDGCKEARLTLSYSALGTQVGR